MATSTIITEYTRANSGTPFWHEYAAADSTRASQLAAYDQFLTDNCGVISITRIVTGDTMRRTVVVNGSVNAVSRTYSSAINAAMPGYEDSIMAYYVANDITITDQTVEVA